ncbi:MAG: hypothetical protein ACLTBP_04180 [Frisingicoccus sp.]
MTLEIKAMLQSFGKGNDDIRVLSRIYGLGGKDFYAEDAEILFQEGKIRRQNPSIISV